MHTAQYTKKIRKNSVMTNVVAFDSPKVALFCIFEQRNHGSLVVFCKGLLCNDFLDGFVCQMKMATQLHRIKIFPVSFFSLYSKILYLVVVFE